MNYQLCISMRESEQARLEEVIKITGLSKVDIFRIGLNHVEDELKNQDKKDN